MLWAGFQAPLKTSEMKNLNPGPVLYRLFLSVFLLYVPVMASPAFAQNKSIILGRPTNSSVTASVLFDQPAQFYLEYGTQPGSFPLSTPILSNTADVPDEVDISNLLPDKRYYYRLRWKLPAQTLYQASPVYNFHTQRPPGSTFCFNIEADEHLYDKKGVRSMYQVTLANQARDSADFMLTLGDIFGDDHTPLETTSEEMKQLRKDYLQYLSSVCHSVPFYVCLGNHEGENGFFLNQTAPANIAVYSTLWRKFYYPNPYPNDFYSGNVNSEGFGMGLPENYYAWTWGDALFVVLDVYRDCSVNDKPIKWDWTLGQTQYNWLKSTLESSNARFKFVFAHHTRGQGRGGVVTATGFEWGGMDNGQYKFPQYRPGWAMPIHQLMRANGVNIFFQGHDHLYAKEVLDSIVYQEVPMAADSTYEIGFLANASAYTDVKLRGTGHVRVTVGPDEAKVDFVRAYLPQDTIGGQNVNGSVGHSYTVQPYLINSVFESRTGRSPFAVYPVPARQFFEIQSEEENLRATEFTLLDLQGRVCLKRTMEGGQNILRMDAAGLPRGLYVLRWQNPTYQWNSRKIILE